MNKKTAVSPANIAFIKYWGQKDSKLCLPYNNSISMNLSACLTTTTVEFGERYIRDEIWLKKNLKKGSKMESFVNDRIISHLDRIREMAGSKLFAKVVTHNSFPSDAGIASSASGFSALTLAATAALGIFLSEKELSRLSRLSSSGSASRSIPDGFVEWKAGNDKSSYACSIKPPEWWDLVDIVVVTSKGKKKKASLSGHKLAVTSPYFNKRQKLLPDRIKRVKNAIDTKNIFLLGSTIEEEAVDMHLIAMSAKEPIFYWNGTTVEIMKKLREWREEGLFGYFTIDAGPNVHVICQREHEKELNRRLNFIDGVLDTIINYPAKGARLSNKHLF